MKKLFITMMVAMIAIAANAQRYNVGSSRSNTDYFSTTRTTHEDSYGNTWGSSSSSTDYFGTTNTEHYSNNSSDDIWSW